MARIKNAIGKLSGRIGNVILYQGANGENLCRGTWLQRKPGKEVQKRQAAAFGTLSQQKTWLAEVIEIGFPENGKGPKGYNGFASANGWGVVSAEKIDPDKPISQRKKAMKEFRGRIDYGKLRVASGPLVPPATTAELDEEGRSVTFSQQALGMNAIDCFLDDVVYGVILCRKVLYCDVVKLGTRGENLTTSIALDEEVVPKEVAVYVFATSADGKIASESVCLRQPEEA